MEDFAVASKLKEKLGEDVVEDLDKWMREIIQSETKDQYSQILSRFDILEDRYEGISDEVYRLRGEMNGFRTEVNQRFDAMNDRILSSIKWSVGTIATFGLIITILITIFKFLG